MDVLLQGGREITSEDIEHVHAVVESCRGLSRKELAHTICEHWGWVTASGAHKVQACLTLLEKLEAQGKIHLPEKQEQPKRKKSTPPPMTSRTDRPTEEIAGGLAELGGVSLEIVTDEAEKGLWSEYMERYHYLGYRKPFGFRLRYFIVSKHGRLGCALIAGAAKAIGARDRWIGWGEKQRLNNLPWVVNNTRFLIFPWVRVRFLASHVLGRLARRVRDDWHERWGYRPVLMETFVDPARFRGISYQAAGWTCLGQTTGRGLRRPGRDYSTTVKMIYVRPLVRDFRQWLCSDSLTGRRDE